ncbi:MAG TPA: HPr family phosphocarrier protein [Rhabdochlamydiaceae bacterium]|nr:HPr family phosphocarrier protein [Rhabdochlamydiaceae bacterium]
MKATARVKIKNPLGLHARPATIIAKLLQTSKSSVYFTYRKETINARSIMSILMLAASKNSHITITVEGEDAETTMKKLVEAFENQFGEEHGR